MLDRLQPKDSQAGEDTPQSHHSFAASNARPSGESVLNTLEDLYEQNEITGKQRMYSNFDIKQFSPRFRILFC